MVRSKGLIHNLYMVSSGYSDFQNVDLWTNLTKSGNFFVGVEIFLEGHSDALNRTDFDATASAVQFYIILHKILAETVE